MISIEEALRCVREQARPLAGEAVPLLAARGRTLAQVVKADRDYPPFDRATMDGYAVVSSDLMAAGGSGELTLAGTLYAGEPPTVAVAKGNCLRIMTGAALPPGADAVVKQEETTAHNGAVRFACSDLRPGLNVSLRGEDVRGGAELLCAGALCTPPVIGLLATVGLSSVEVVRPPRTTILVTGDELVPVDEAVGPVTIRASNAYVLSALLSLYGVESRIHFVRDTRADLDAALEQACERDLLLATGGVSVGDRDFVPDALRQAGAQIDFHGVDMKPGKPLLFGRLKNTVVFGLPGNPFSVQVTMRIFVDSWLRACLGLPERTRHRLPFKGRRSKGGGRPEFFCARLPEWQGSTVVEAVPHNGSGDVTAGLGSDGLAFHPGPVATIADQDMVEFYPW